MFILCLTVLIELLSASNLSNYINTNNINTTESNFEIVQSPLAERPELYPNMLLQTVNEFDYLSLERTSDIFPTKNETVVAPKHPQLMLANENKKLLELEIDVPIHEQLKIKGVIVARKSKVKGKNKQDKLDKKETKIENFRNHIHFILGFFAVVGMIRFVISKAKN
ncbi:putative SP-containing membrane protein [Vairimorpha necatrix]|uniref:SP-containing membrane protein n=1 Tax=Vairimorpha necatrix TaxID=6039 RepID=A0AAX4JA06_9MICR